MMKSVACLLDSIPQDDVVDVLEDFVLVESLSELELKEKSKSEESLETLRIGVLDPFLHPQGDDDADSYDYCEDAFNDEDDVSVQHRTITSTSNPIEAVQENFFFPTEAANVPPTVDYDAFEKACSPSPSSSSNDNEEDDQRDISALVVCRAKLTSAPVPSAELKITNMPVGPSLNEISFKPSLDDISFHASNSVTDSEPVSDQELSMLLLQMTSQFGVDAPEQFMQDQDCSPAVNNNFVQHHVGRTEAEVPLKTSLLHNSPTSSSTTTTDSTKKQATTPLHMLFAPNSCASPDGQTSTKNNITINNNVLSKKKRRKQLKIAKKAAAAAAAALSGPLITNTLHAPTFPAANTTAINSSSLSSKRKGRVLKRGAKVAVAEALKSHQEYKQQQLTMTQKNMVANDLRS